MPSLFRLFGYTIYFWSNEGVPLEYVHVHVAKGRPSPHATKIWLTQEGKCILDNNASKIPERELKAILRVIEARSDWILMSWQTTFGTIQYHK